MRAAALRLTCLLVLLLGTLSCAPSWRARSIEVDRGPANVERGRYLANHVAICMTCHSERDYGYFGGPPKPGTEGRGGLTIPELFKTPRGLIIPAPNITPFALADWTDGEVFRAITGGLDRDGEPLFPAHPYSMYRLMPEEDVEAIIAYLRSLEPLPDTLPERYLKYRSLEGMLDLFPSPPAVTKGHLEPGTRKYEKNLMRLAGCMWCHSPQTRLAFPIPGQEYTGGTPLLIPPPGGGTAYSTNLTPDPTGLGGWTREAFIARFKRTTSEVVHRQPITPGGFNSLMPWEAYSGMTEEDLGILYDALRRRRPVQKMAPRWTPAPE